MNRLAAAALALGFAACQRSGTPESPAPAKAEAKAHAEPRMVELDEAAQRQARLVIKAAEIRSLPEVIRANGRLTNNENATWRVGSITDGRIIRVLVKPGDRVEKRQILARLYSHDIHEAQAEYRRALAELNRTQANLEFAARQRDRLRRLLEMKAASVEQVEHAENEWNNARTSLDNARNEVARTRLHLEEFLEVPLGATEQDPRSADPELHPENQIPIRAPEAGVVLTQHVTQGSVVSAASDLFTISDLSTIWALAAVQEEHLSRLRVGMPALVNVQAYPNQAFPGRVGKIGEKLDPETRTVQVRVEIANQAGLLKPEMYSIVDLQAGRTTPALLISQECVQDVGGQQVVFVAVSPSRFATRPVQLGRTIQGQVEVLRGLEAGERVVAQGSFILKSQLLRATLGEE